MHVWTSLCVPLLNIVKNIIYKQKIWGVSKVCLQKNELSVFRGGKLGAPLEFA